MENSGIVECGMGNLRMLNFGKRYGLILTEKGLILTGGTHVEENVVEYSILIKV